MTKNSKIDKLAKDSNLEIKMNRCFIYSWKVDKSIEETTVIRAYGLNEDNQTVCLRIQDFTPYLYIELDNRIEWTPKRFAFFKLYLLERLGEGLTPLNVEMVKRYKLYGANVDPETLDRIPFSFAFCNFSNRDAPLRKLRGTFSATRQHLIKDISVSKRFKFKIHECDADPVLQLTSWQSIPSCGWVQFEGRSIEGRLRCTEADHEFYVPYKKLSEYECDQVPRPLVMSFDLEVNSSNPAAMPNAKNTPGILTSPKSGEPTEGDCIFQISVVFHREGEKPESYIITLGDPLPEDVGEGVHIISPRTNPAFRKLPSEKFVLSEYARLMRRMKPNVVIGYNILGFDIDYMAKRIEEMDGNSVTVPVTDDPNSSNGQWSYVFKMQGFHGHFENIDGESEFMLSSSEPRTIKWSSSAYRNQEFSFFDVEGRVFIDLLPLVKRDYRLDNYRLKTVSTYFLGESKDPLNAQGIFKCYRMGWEDLSQEERNEMLDEDPHSSKRFRKARRAMGIVSKYCVQDSLLVTKLFDKTKTWVGLCEMAKTCNVPIESLMLRGQQIKVYSQIYKYCRHENTIVEKDGYVVQDNEHYQGAYVFEPVPGCYDRVVPFDFASLYPTTIIAYNIDYQTLVTDPRVPDEKCHVMEWEDHVYCEHDPKVIRRDELSDKINLLTVAQKELRVLKALRNPDARTKKESDIMNRKIYDPKIREKDRELKVLREERSEIMKSKPKFPMCEKRKYRFLKEPKGILPTVINNLLTRRKMVRKGAKAIAAKADRSNMTEDEIFALDAQLDVLDKRQLALKISANSMYGIMGVQKGMLPFMPGAMCTTFKGRENIGKVAKSIVEDHGGNLIYGDTDSNYVSFPDVTTAQETWDRSEQVAAEITKMFPPPIVLEFEEEIYWRFFILTKKRYMYKACLRDGVVSDKIGKKGVLLARRDNCQFIRDTYESVVRMIFDRVPRDDILYEVMSRIQLMFSNSLPATDFVVTKAVGGWNQCEAEAEVDENGKICGRVGDYKVALLSTNAEEREEQIIHKGATDVKDYYTKCLPPAVQLAIRMQSRGERVDAGSRLEYVVTDTGGHTAKQGTKIEEIAYFRRHTKHLKIDFYYYLKQLVNPMDQLLNTAFGNDVGCGRKCCGFRKVFREADGRLRETFAARWTCGEAKYSKDLLNSVYIHSYRNREKLMNELRDLHRPTIIVRRA